MGAPRDFWRILFPVGRVFFIALTGAALYLFPLSGPVPAEDTTPPARASLQGPTGLWDMPNARVLPDFNVRLGASDSGPYRAYNGAVGLFDRLEVHGRFTEINTIQAFPGEGFGNYKDRSIGARAVLFPEKDQTPQVAAGVYDVTGTALFGSRYLVASKRIQGLQGLGPLDLSLGLGQGVFGGENVYGKGPVGSPKDNAGRDFLFSSPFRRTRPFAGLEYSILPELTATVEYSSLNHNTLFGYRDSSWTRLNAGLKYDVTDALHVQAALIRGRDPSFGVGLSFPLEPEGFVAWKGESAFKAMEKERWEAFEADNEGLAIILARSLERDGFSQVTVSCGAKAVWVEVENTRHLSDARAFGRMGRVIDSLAPERIKTLFLNIKRQGQVRQSLKTNRAHLVDFLNSRLDQEGFLAFSELDLHGSRHWEEFAGDPAIGPACEAGSQAFFFSVEPKIKTFMENRKGFFKHKAYIQTRAGYRPWKRGVFLSELQSTFFNQYRDLAFDPLEEEPSRTDVVRYESRHGTRLSMLAFDQVYLLPWDAQGRTAWGMFESAYGGAGVEVFRFFSDGRLGCGLEGEIVRKRDPENNLLFSSESTRLYRTAYLNLYARILPKAGVSAGAKIGRFLAGDNGARFELRRENKYFTLGGWYTVTNTGHMESSKNTGHREKGIYIRIPFSVFRDKDSPGHFRYSISSFTRDPGQSVRQPSSLFPLDDTGLPGHTREHLEDARH